MLEQDAVHVGGGDRDVDARRLEGLAHLFDVVEELRLAQIAPQQHLAADDSDVDVPLGRLRDQAVDLVSILGPVGAQPGANGGSRTQIMGDVASVPEVVVAAEGADPLGVGRDQLQALPELHWRDLATPEIGILVGVDVGTEIQAVGPVGWRLGCSHPEVADARHDPHG